MLRTYREIGRIFFLGNLSRQNLEKSWEVLRMWPLVPVVNYNIYVMSLHVAVTRQSKDLIKFHNFQS